MSLLIIITLASLALAAASAAYVVKLRRQYSVTPPPALTTPKEETSEEPIPTVENHSDEDDVTQRVSEWMWHTMDVPCDGSITLESVAKGIDMPRSDLSAYLQQHPQLTFKSWISNIRIRHCHELLLTTELTLSEIAYMCGYADLPTMSKAFKRQYGVSPSKYRKAVDDAPSDATDK